MFFVPRKHRFAAACGRLVGVSPPNETRRNNGSASRLPVVESVGLESHTGSRMLGQTGRCPGPTNPPDWMRPPFPRWNRTRGEFALPVDPIDQD